jgi:polyferredoxin
VDQLALYAIATGMAVLTAWLLKKGSTAKTLTDAGIVVFLLVMMVSMFVSAVAYLYSPSFVTVYELVALNMVSMSIGLIPILAALFKGDKPLAETRVGRAVSSKALVVVTVIGLALVSEAFMGWTFALVSGISSTSQPAIVSLVDSVSSYWFVFTMAAEMAVTLYLVGRMRFPRAFRWLVGLQAAGMVLSPTAIHASAWADFAVWGNSAVMLVVVILVFEFLYRNRQVTLGSLTYLVWVTGAYALMMAGIFVWEFYGDPALFALSVIVEMGAYFGLVLDESFLPSTPLRDWLSMPKAAFGLLLSVFVAEFFMGGALDLEVHGPSFFTSLPFASLSGPVTRVVAELLYDTVVFIGSITDSYLFLGMMGVEMGALVLFKMRGARDPETKIRLGLVMVAYAIYTLFLPVFVFSGSLAKVPWIGWTMGIGTAGALAPAVVIALVVTYLISGGMSFLFGSRQLCSLFCTAALMYQGTTIDAMSRFNRTSRIGRRYLTSRLPSAYKVVVSLVWASLLVGALVSYLTATKAIDLTVFGTDAGFFLYSFYFSFLWYVVWVMTPFVGTYGCATTGICGWGAFNQVISRIGLFRIKVRDSGACVSCKTKDCAKVCPVGITDMPGAFIDKGEFRSMKCIGVGDCVSACPYNNVFFFDVRNWIRMKLNIPVPPHANPPGRGVSEGPIDFTAAGRDMSWGRSAASPRKGVRRDDSTQS